MFSVIIMVTLAIASAVSAVPAPLSYQAPPSYSYYYYQPQVAHQNFVQSRSVENVGYVPAQSAPVSSYQVAPPSYFYQSRAAPDNYVQAASAQSLAVYAQAPSAKSIQRRPSQLTVHPSIANQQVKVHVNSKGQPYVYKAWHVY